MKVTKNKNAFTLIELLVVIAIIAILSALLFPTIKSAKMSSRSINCTNQLNQIGIMLTLYYTNNGYYPVGWGKDNENETRNVTWANRLIPYTSEDDKLYTSKGLFCCPEQNVPILPINSPNQFSNPRDTYGIHQRLADPNDKKNRLSSRIKRPSQIIFVADGSQSLGAGVCTATLFTPFNGWATETQNALKMSIPLTGDIDNSSGNGSLRYRHNEKINCLFSDMHVDSFNKGEVTYANLECHRSN